MKYNIHDRNPYWDKKFLSEVCEIFSGGTPSTKNKKYWGGNVNWLSSGETRNIFITHTEKKITRSGIKNSSTKLAKINDVVVASAGQGHTRGQTSFCLIDTYVNQSVVVLRTIKKIILPKFLFYNLKSRYIELRRLSDSHSSRGSLPKNILLTINISLPSLLEQVKITKILWDLDSKIENLQKQNKILEQIAQTVFKSWFVDYEFPDADGNPYKSFEGEMIYSEELEQDIPKSWKASNIKNDFKLIMGQSPPGSTYNKIGKGSIFFQGRTDFGDRFPSMRIFCTAPTRFAKKNETLVSVRAPVGDVNIALQDCCIGRGLASVLHKSMNYSYTYYSMLLLKPIFENFESEGTVFGSITKTDFENIKIQSPSKKIINLFQNIIEVFDKKISNNYLETLQLSTIRDVLLPKLMSGKIRI